MRIGASIGTAIWKLPTLCISKNLFMRGFMMDGNFQAEHMRMKNPQDDIPLSDGSGFMVSKKAYESHLKSAVERRQVTLYLVFRQAFAHALIEIDVP